MLISSDISELPGKSQLHAMDKISFFNTIRYESYLLWKSEEVTHQAVGPASSLLQEVMTPHRDCTAWVSDDVPIQSVVTNNRILHLKNTYLL